MAKYLLLKHYRGGPEPTPQGEHPDGASGRPQEITDHIAFMDHVADVLRERGEFVDGQALSPEGTFVRFDAEGKPPVTDGPFAETKDLIAGWMVIDVDSVERAHEAAAFLSSAPGAGGRAAAGVDRGAAVPRDAPTRWRTDRQSMDDLLKHLGPQVLGVLVRRGADFAAAEDAVQEAWSRRCGAGPTARRTTRRAGWSPSPGASTSTRCAPRRPAGARGARTSRSRRRVRPSRPTTRCCCCSSAAHPALTPGVGGRADAAGGRRPDHPADRRGVPGAGVDDGASGSAGPSGRSRAAARASPATSATVLQGALPDLQRGLHRRGRPGRRGDPADPAAGRAQPTSPRSPGCSR